MFAQEDCYKEPCMYLSYACPSPFAESYVHSKRIQGLFKELHIIRHWKELTTTEGKKQRSLFIDYMHQYSLIDAMTVCCAYENYFKSVMLINGCLIHKLCEPKQEIIGFNLPDTIKGINRKIKKGPIYLKDVFGEITLDTQQILISYIENWDCTLGLSNYFSNQYQNLIRIEKENLDFIIDLHAKRNSLHFMTSSVEGYSVPHFYSDWKKFIQYSTELFDQHNEKSRIQSQLGPVLWESPKRLA